MGLSGRSPERQNQIETIALTSSGARRTRVNLRTASPQRHQIEARIAKT
jgi:hypothetical protein